MADKKIESRDLKILTETKNRKGAVKIRIVEWIIDGKRYPQLEKREFFGPDGEGQKIGKNKGFNFSDMKTIEENLPEILNILARPTTDPIPENAPPVNAAPPASTTNDEFEY